jgi:hypothetical protein
MLQLVSLGGSVLSQYKLRQVLIPPSKLIGQDIEEEGMVSGDDCLQLAFALAQHCSQPIS